jgi:hypothetical protein
MKTAGTNLTTQNINKLSFSEFYRKCMGIFRVFGSMHLQIFNKGTN